MISANRQAEQVLGLSRHDMAKRSYNAPSWKITDYQGNSFPDAQLPFQIVKRTGGPVYDVRHAIVWPDGKQRLLSINAAPIFDSNGQFDGMVSAIDDITEQITAEQTIKSGRRKACRYI